MNEAGLEESICEVLCQRDTHPHWAKGSPALDSLSILMELSSKHGIFPLKRDHRIHCLSVRLAPFKELLDIIDQTGIGCGRSWLSSEVKARSEPPQHEQHESGVTTLVTYGNLS